MNENQEPQIQTVRLKVNPPRARRIHAEAGRLIDKSAELQARGYELQEVTLYAVLVRPTESKRDGESRE